MFIIVSLFIKNLSIHNIFHLILFEREFWRHLNMELHTQLKCENVFWFYVLIITVYITQSTGSISSSRIIIESSYYLKKCITIKSNRCSSYHGDHVHLLSSLQQICTSITMSNNWLNITLSVLAWLMFWWLQL